MKEIEPLQKHLISLYEGDFDELAALFPAVKPNTLIRALVRDLITRVKANDPTVPKLDIKVEL